MNDKARLKQALQEHMQKEAGIFSPVWRALRSTGRTVKNLPGDLLASGGSIMKGKDLKSVARTAAQLGAVGLLLSGGAAAAQGLVGAIKDPIKKRLGRNRMYRENNWLRHEDKGTVDKYFSTLFRFAPTMAMDPLVSGSFMKKQLEFKDIGIQPTDVSTLANIQKAVKDRSGDSIIRSAFSPGEIKDVGGLLPSDRHP